jgi:capsular polysaccharide export protein
MRQGKPTFLILQAPPGPFAPELRDALAARGCEVHRINLCLGDAVQWGWRPAVSYRGPHGEWRGYLAEYIRRHGITDVLYYGDRLPYHRVAVDVVRQLGIRGTVMEFGYLRPDWITLERGGMSGLSHFPLDPAAIKSAAARLPRRQLSERYAHAFGVEAFREVFHHLTTFFGTPFYPRYKADSYYNPLLNYLSYIPRLLASGRRGKRAAVRTRNWLQMKRRYALVPLQMQNDYQLRASSPFRHQREAIQLVLESLQRAAPPDYHVMFKIHPLDNGWERWARVVGEIATDLGIPRRVSTIDGGHLPTLLDHCSRVILINSTVGMHAIQRLRPTKVLGLAMFDIPGLTHQGSLDDFWSSPELPDPELRDCFIRLLAATIQIQGSFYNPEGRARAIDEIATRLIDGTVNEPGGYVDALPRLARARELGIRLFDE